MKRRYKLLIGFIITGIILTIIFFITKDKKVYYLSLGDSLAVGQTPTGEISNSYSDYIKEYLSKKGVLEFYTKDFSKRGYRSIDLLNDLYTNKSITVDDKKIPIKHALIKADLVTLSIGANDLFYKLKLGNINETNFEEVYTYIDEVILDIDKLLYELRISCKEQIMVFGFYNPFVNFSDGFATSIEPIILYANKSMKKIVEKYDMTFINIHNIFLENPYYLSNSLEIHPLKSGYKAMANEAIKLIDKKVLAK